MPINQGDYRQLKPQRFSSVSGCDIHAAVVVSDDIAKDTKQAYRYKVFAELQTITVTSHRGIAPVRRLGEAFVYDYVRGTRTIAGTLVFTMLDSEVLKEVFAQSARETGNGPFLYYTDQIPPFNITITARNEDPFGEKLTMVLFDVSLGSHGKTLSVDDIYTEVTYNYVARWATPFISDNDHDKLKKLLNWGQYSVKKPLSSLK